MSNQSWRPGQPLPIALTEVNPHEKQTYSEFGNGGGYRETGTFRPIDNADLAMANTFKRMMINALPTQYDKVRDHLDAKYKNTLQTIETDIKSELIIAGHSNEGTAKTIQTLNRDKAIVTHFIQNRYAQLLAAQQQATNFSGGEPLTLNHQELINVTTRRFAKDPAQFEKSAAHQLKTYANSVQAAYKARLLTTAIQILNHRSNSLDANLVSLHAQERARVAAQQEAQRQAQIAVQQQAQAARAKAEAEHTAKEAERVKRANTAAKLARQREIEKYAERQRKYKTATDAMDRFDSILLTIKDEPEDIHDKLRWLKDKYRHLVLASKEAEEAEFEADHHLSRPRTIHRMFALSEVEIELDDLVLAKYGTEQITFPPINGANTSVRPLVVTSDGQIAGYEGSPFSFSKALDSLNGLRATITNGPFGVFLASVLYTPVLGNGELQRSPLVLTIPLSQLYPQRKYLPSGRPSTLDWLPYRVVSSVRGEHTQLYLESQKNSLGVRVRQASLAPQTNLYTFTTEGLAPITLTWTPDSPPGDELLNITDLPATDSGIRIYPGARVTQIEGRVDEYPSCDYDDRDDYILEFPIESGIESIYLMATRGGPRYEPGTVTGRGREAGNNWLGSAVESNGAPIPAQIADQLRGQDFRNFDRFRESFWKAVAVDGSLRRQFGKVDLEQMANGAAPYAEPLDTVGGREKIEIHHKQRIADGGDVYDLENLSILTPKAHIELHKKGTQQ